MQHAWNNNLMINAHHIGEKHPRAILKETDVLQIKSLIKEKSKQELADIFGVSVCTINDIEKERSWKHLWKVK